SPVWRGAPILAFCGGLVVGGMLIAGAFLVVGVVVRSPVPWPVRVGLLGAWYLVLIGREAGVVRLRLWENRRLVPETVFRLGRFLGPFQFGLEMGTGVRTYLPTGLPYLLAAAIALFAGAPTALVAGLGFGLGRAVMLLANVSYDREGGWDIQWLNHHRQIKVLLMVVF